MKNYITGSKGLSTVFMIALAIGFTCLEALAASVQGTVRSCDQGVERIATGATKVVFWDKLIDPSAQNVRFTSSTGAYVFDGLAAGKLYYLAVINDRYGSVPVQEVALESDGSKNLGRTCLVNPRSFVQLPLPPFSQNSSVISPEMVQKLQRDVQVIRMKPAGSYVLISGYISNEENPALGLARARALRDFFVSMKLPVNDFQLQSFVATCPHESNDPAANRRVTYDIIREGASALDLLRNISCASDAAPRATKPNDVRVVRVEQTPTTLTVTLAYTFMGRASDGAYINVHALAGNVITPIARGSAPIERGDRTVTVTLTKDPASASSKTTQLFIMMLRNSVQLYSETFPYEKEWK